MLKKKVLFIMDSMEGGGAEKALATLLQHFDYGKYEVDLCLIQNSGVFLAEVPAEVEIIPLYKQPRSLISKIENRIYYYFGIDFFHSARIKSKVKKQYDTIVSFIEGKPLRLHSYIYNSAKVNVAWVHTDMLLNKYTSHRAVFYSPGRELKTYTKMDKIAFVSYKAMEQFKKKHTIAANHNVIYNPIDKEDILNKSVGRLPEKRKFTVCSVGSLKEIKAFDRVLRVAKKLKDANYNIDFWIIGDGPLKSALKEQCRELGLEDSVHFLGFHSPPYSLMKAADLFLVVSKVEGFPIALCEALCLGLPVIATKCTGAIEILDDGKYGFLTEHDDEAIYNALKGLLDDKNKLEYYKNMAIQRSELFNLQKTMKEICRIIE